MIKSWITNEVFLSNWSDSEIVRLLLNFTRSLACPFLPARNLERFLWVILKWFSLSLGNFAWKTCGSCWLFTTMMSLELSYVLGKMQDFCITHYACWILNYKERMLNDTIYVFILNLSYHFILKIIEIGLLKLFSVTCDLVILGLSNLKQSLTCLFFCPHRIWRDFYEWSYNVFLHHEAFFNIGLKTHRSSLIMSVKSLILHLSVLSFCLSSFFFFLFLVQTVV